MLVLDGRSVAVRLTYYLSERSRNIQNQRFVVPPVCIQRLIRRYSHLNRPIRLSTPLIRTKTHLIADKALMVQRQQGLCVFSDCYLLRYDTSPISHNKRTIRLNPPLRESISRFASSHYANIARLTGITSARARQGRPSPELFDCVSRMDVWRLGYRRWDTWIQVIRYDACTYHSESRVCGRVRFAPQQY